MNILKNIGWRFKLGILLVILSIILYIIHFFVFRQPNTEFFYIGIDLAFLPLEVLVVVLVIETAIGAREKSIMLEKLNMVIGTFFSEVGTDLLSRMTLFDPDTDKIRKSLIINDMWTTDDYNRARREVEDYDYTLKISGDDVASLEFLESNKEFLLQKRKFLLALLENPNLLEHEAFTDLLRAVFHLTEELENRADLTRLSKPDYNHLAADTQRAYSLLIYEWLEYMEYLMNNYPYLFSLAMRMNPFDPEAKVEIED
ncbi:MAG TPA: hypothetical protein VK444_08000 [Methanobacteriaceae archaeon]|nr:hypothetical protein [Methanobacteriaceae archaeon]